jgi:hypothetical protein
MHGGFLIILKWYRNHQLWRSFNFLLFYQIFLFFQFQRPGLDFVLFHHIFEHRSSGSQFLEQQEQFGTFWSFASLLRGLGLFVGRSIYFVIIWRLWGDSFQIRFGGREFWVMFSLPYLDRLETSWMDLVSIEIGRSDNLGEATCLSHWRNLGSIGINFLIIF